MNISVFYNEHCFSPNDILGSSEDFYLQNQLVESNFNNSLLVEYNNNLIYMLSDGTEGNA